MALRAIKSPSRFARHTGQSPTRNVYHISVRMLPGRGPGHMAPPVPAGRAHHVRPCPDPLLCLGRLLRRSRPALARCGCALRAASAPARGRRPCFAAPVRRLRPRFARRGRACLACPPLSRSARVRAFALRGRSLAPSACGPALVCAAGSLFGRPCVARAWALCSAWPRGGPLRPRFAASGPGAPRPAPVARPLAALFLRGGRAFGCARGPARACCASVAAASVVAGFSLLPPRPCRPAGAPGEREASGLSAAFRGPLAAAPRAVGGPRCAISGAVHNPEIVNRVLTFRCGRAILDLRGPFRSRLGAAL